MIAYHGGPITPEVIAAKFWRGRHAMISFAYPEQLACAAAVADSFALDNGAYTEWKNGKKPEWEEYYKWVDQWRKHPGFDFALIPDTIDGDENANDRLVFTCWPFTRFDGVPVWHLHERLERLELLASEFPRVALGSSGEWANPGTQRWWMRMAHAMKAVCDEHGMPKARLHGLRMLNSQILKHLPLASADSTNVARNVRLDSRWSGPYAPTDKAVRAEVIASMMLPAKCAEFWMEMHIQDQLLQAWES